MLCTSEQANYRYVYLYMLTGEQISLGHAIKYQESSKQDPKALVLKDMLHLLRCTRDEGSSQYLTHLSL